MPHAHPRRATGGAHECVDGDGEGGHIMPKGSGECPMKERPHGRRSRTPGVRVRLARGRACTACAALNPFRVGGSVIAPALARERAPSVTSLLVPPSRRWWGLTKRRSQPSSMHAPLWGPPCAGETPSARRQRDPPLPHPAEQGRSLPAAAAPAAGGSASSAWLAGPAPPSSRRPRWPA